MTELEKEITFTGNCQICGRKETAVRNHHLVPQRLIKILRPKFQKKWGIYTVTACNSCNKKFHPENKLYEKIAILEDIIKVQTGKNWYEFLTTKITSQEESNSNIYIEGNQE